MHDHCMRVRLTEYAKWPTHCGKAGKTLQEKRSALKVRAVEMIQSKAGREKNRERKHRLWGVDSRTWVIGTEETKMENFEEKISRAFSNLMRTINPQIQAQKTCPGRIKQKKLHTRLYQIIGSF